MLKVITQPPLLSARALVFSWFASLAAFLTTPLIVVVGQGFGSWLSGAEWIGISTPLTRHPWALINQPNLAFASTGSAAGYWLGAFALAVILGVSAPALASRSKANAAKLFAIQLAWASVVVAGAWIPLFDLDDGHLSRWLVLNDLPPLAVWIAPLIAGLAFIPTELQLLALGREGRSQFGLLTRLLTVGLFLWLPVFGWIAIFAVAQGGLAVRPCLACLIPIAISAVVATRGWGRLQVLVPEPISIQSFLAIGAVSVILGVTLWFCGRPLGNGRVAGFQWGKATAYNNIRTWIQPNPGWDDSPLAAQPEVLD